MPSRNLCLALVAGGLLLAGSGCGKFGRVSQGRVIEFDPSKGLITIIQDSNSSGSGQPRFDILPPLTVRIPRNPAEMGPQPEAGKLMEVDAAGRRAVVFDARAGALRSVAVTLLERQDNVAPDDRRVAGLEFPVIDRERRTVTVYSAARRQLLRLSVADEHLVLPPESWKMGDDVRYYYKDSGQALRLMNLTRTDLGKAGR